MNDPRSAAIVNARLLRRLAHYGDAMTEFKYAQSLQQTFMLKVEMAGMLMEQGCLRDCLNMLNDPGSSSQRNDEPHAWALCTMMLCALRVAIDMHFPDNLNEASSIYESSLRHLSHEQFEDHHVSMLVIHMNLIHLVRLCGIETAEIPKPSQDFLLQLLNRLVDEGDLQRALEIASLCTHNVTAPDKGSFYQLIIEACVQRTQATKVKSDKVKLAMVCADARVKLADHLVDRGKQDEALSNLVMAEKSYKQFGHATGADLIDLRRCEQRLTASRRDLPWIRKRIEDIIKRLQANHCLEGVTQALMVLLEVAHADQDNELHVEIDQCIHDIFKLRGSRLELIMHQDILIRKWAVTGTVTAQMIRTYESLAEYLKERNTPRMLISVASALVEAYKVVGDTARQECWEQVIASQPAEAVPEYMYFLQNRDVFYSALSGATEAPADAGQELRDLQRELDRMVEYSNPGLIPAQHVHFGVMKLTHLCIMYLGQTSFRSTESITLMVETCLGYSETLVAMVPSPEKTIWEANIVEIQAKLLVTRAILSGDGKTNPESLLLQDAVSNYERAAQMYKYRGQTIMGAFVQQQLATCYRTRWEAEGKPQTSANFAKAIQCLRTAARAFKSNSVDEAYRLARMHFLDLCQEGILSQVQYARIRTVWSWLGFEVLHWLGQVSQIERALPASIRNSTALFNFFHVTLYEEAIMEIADIDNLIDQTREELALLPRQRAILAKQHLRKDENILRFYQTSQILLSMADDHNRSLWQCVQRSKARSVSDFLAIGINIPPGLAQAIKADLEANRLLRQMEEVQRRLKDTSEPAAFFVRREIVLLKRRMRMNAHLSQLLDLREGMPVTWSQLNQLGNTQSACSAKSATMTKARTTWFVDWLSVNGHINVLMVNDKDETYHFSSLDQSKNVSFFQDWVERNIQGGAENDPCCYRHPQQGQQPAIEIKNEEDSMASLFDLKPLVEPILQLAKEGDLLVLCPTKGLHHVPIHAAMIEGDPENEDEPTYEWKALIDKYPIIYTPSLTVYMQCTRQHYEWLREKTSKLSLASRLDGRALGVYEDHDKAEQRRVYETCAEIAKKMQWPIPEAGVSIRHAEFKDALENGTIVYFYGHHDTNIRNVLDEGVRLGLEFGPQLECGPEACVSPLASRWRDRRVTVADMFGGMDSEQSDLGSFKLNRMAAKHVSMVACRSAIQAMAQGDEPLGMETALLHAGASSVLGTMWPLASRDGRKFSLKFYDKVSTAVRTGTIVDIAVTLQNAIVEMKKDVWEETTHPYSWAGFVLYGTWCL